MHTEPVDPRLRQSLLLLAGAATALAVLHFIDHVIRGERVINEGLNEEWNHSGWPFNDDTDKPYLFPIYFVVVMTLVLGGMLLTVRGKVWVGYWLAVSIVLIALLMFVHFVGSSSASAETPGVIARSHQHGAFSLLALIDLFGLLAVLAALAFQSVRDRQRSGHW